MDVLNKFCSTVSSTVSQLSGVLPGNPVTREYEVISHVASAGPGLIWKIYDGYKKSTKQPASIFVFEKKQVVPQDREFLIESLKKGIGQLTKLRHPQILVVQHPLEESRDSLAFATEPVFASLANILGKHDSLPINPEALKNYKLYDVEIKYGLLQIGEGLVFLHKDVKMLHMNICPSSIVVNNQGAWKIFGFDFSIQNSSMEATPAWKCGDIRSLSHEMSRPDLNYLAPEVGLTETVSPASDMYSLGVLIYALFNSGNPLFNNMDWRGYTSNMSKLKNIQNNQLSCVAEGIRSLVKMMLNPTPELRPDEHEFIKTDYFDDVGVKALNYLDSLFQWDNQQKASFYKGLPQILDKLPHRVRLYRIIPCLAKEFVNPLMVPFVLPCVFAIAENCTKQEFSSNVFPHLIQVLKMQEPIQILLILMQKMELLLKITSNEDVKTHVLPLFYKALESEAQEIQELCLSVLPSSAHLIEYTAMKNALLPRIKRLCLSTSNVSVRVNCLVCIGKLLDYLDKWLVLDEVLPFLPQIPSKEPAVLMGILGIYKLVLNHKKMTISKEVMAQKVIPFLMPLAVENFLTLNQFNSIISVIKDMVQRVETEHRVKLEQIQEQQKSLECSMPKSFEPSVGETMTDFFAVKKESTPPIKAIGSLSLEDKKRIVAEAEASRQMFSNAPLTLTPAVPQSKPSQLPVKDLTASLMDASNFSLTGSGNSMAKPMGGFNNAFRQPFPPNQFKPLISNGDVRPVMNQNWSSWGGPSMSSLQSPQQATKPLSKDDINDLLN